MAYGTLKADVIQSDTAGVAPQFNDGNGTQTGTLCRAWVNFNGTGTVAIRASFNVSSITDNGTGDYTVNFTNALADANYSVVATCSGNVIGQTGRTVAISGTNPATTSVRFSTVVGTTNTNDDMLFVTAAVFR